MEERENIIQGLRCDHSTFLSKQDCLFTLLLWNHHFTFTKEVLEAQGTQLICSKSCSWKHLFLPEVQGSCRPSPFPPEPRAGPEKEERNLARANYPKNVDVGSRCVGGKGGLNVDLLYIPEEEFMGQHYISWKISKLLVLFGFGRTFFAGYKILGTQVSFLDNLVNVKYFIFLFWTLKKSETCLNFPMFNGLSLCLNPQKSLSLFPFLYSLLSHFSLLPSHLSLPLSLLPSNPVGCVSWLTAPI